MDGTRYATVLNTNNDRDESSDVILVDSRM